MFHIHACVETISTMFTLLCSLHLLSPPSRTLPSTCLVLYSCPALFKCLFIGVLHGILTVNRYLYLVGLTPAPLLFLTLFLLPCIIQHFSICFVVSYSYSDVIYFNIIHSTILFSPPSLSLL
jgi:hypothetical protein